MGSFGGPPRLDLGGMASPSSPTTQRNADADLNIKPSQLPLSPTANNRRSFYDRTFSKLEKGSLRGSIFNMISAALGGGVLSLSYVFVLSGWATGLILIVVGFLASRTSNLMIAKLATDHNCKNIDEMAFKAGGTCFRKFLQIVMLIYATGSCIGYQIFMGQLLSYLMEQLLPDDKDFFTTFEFRLLVNLPIAGVVLLPLSLKRDMSSLTFAGILSVIAITYTLLVLLIETPFYWQEYRHAEDTVVYAFKIDANFLTSCSLVFFAYTCQLSLLPVYSELVKPNYRRIKKVVDRAQSFHMVFYLLIASAGYFSTFNATSDVVIQRDPLPAYTPDYTMLGAAVGICVVLFAAFPQVYNPCRNQFFLLCFNEPNFSQKQNFICTFVFISLTVCVAIFYPNVSTVLSILGGLCSVSICYTIPRKCQNLSSCSRPRQSISLLTTFRVFVNSILAYQAFGQTLDGMVQSMAVDVLQLPDFDRLRQRGLHRGHAGHGRQIPRRPPRHSIQAAGCMSA